MALSASDLSTLSRLLDEAMELPAFDVEAWLRDLPEEHARLASQLREMLASRTGDTGFLAGGPNVGADETLARAGDRVGPYRLIREIGRGGMGAVWLAEQVDGRLKRNVALKLPRLAWGAGLAERMARERDIGALLEHPAIARLYDAGVDGQGRPFLAFEYIDGQPIDAWCEASGLDVPSRLRLMVEVTRAVAYAHGRLVVHRDLKPSNILVSSDGHAHLLDFGIAKLLHEAAPGEVGLTQEQGRVLTPHYASPEQIAGEPITVQSDVYSLGVLLYEVLTGVLPHTPHRKGLAALEEAILAGDAAPASSKARDGNTARALRGDLDAILGKALKSTPALRYSSAEALAEDIERHLRGATVTARPDSLGYRLRKAVVRNRIAVAASIAVLAAVLGGAGVSIVQAQRASRAAERQRLVTDFVSDVFRLNSRSELTNTTARELTGDRLLAEGALMVSRRFPGQPEMQAELYGVVSEQFLEMGAGDQAVDYSTRQVEALTLVRAEDSVQAAAMIRLAKALILKGRNADADNRSRRAIEMAKGDDALHAAALATLAEALLNTGKLAECDATLDRLDETVRRLGKESVAQAWSYALRGSTLGIANRYPESAASWQRGIDMALRVEGPLSVAAISMRATRSRQLISLGETAGGRLMGDAAIQALRQRGGAGVIAAEVLAAFQARRLYGWEVISYREAIDIIDRGIATLATQAAAPDAMHKRMQFERGLVVASWGNVASGWQAVSESVQAALAASDSPYAKFYVAASAQSVALDAGDFESARRWNKEVFSLRSAMGERNHPFVLTDYSVAALIESNQGRFEAALAILDSAPKVDLLVAGKEAVALMHDLLGWTRAQVLADSGETAAASKVVAELDPIGNAQHRALLADLQCRGGQAKAGQRTFESLIEEEAPSHYEHSPDVARLRAQAGLCALAGGDRNAAGILAEKSRAAFVAQPAVSFYFKSPLFKLERALGRQSAT